MSGFMQKRLFGIFAKREMNYFTTILFRGMREIGHISRFAVPGKVTELREQIPGEFSQRAWWLSIDLYHSWTVSGICSTPAREVKAAFQSCFSLTMPNTNLSPQMWIFLTGESFKKGMKNNPICSFTNLSDVKFTYDNSESNVSSKTGRRGWVCITRTRVKVRHCDASNRVLAEILPLTQGAGQGRESTLEIILWPLCMHPEMQVQMQTCTHMCAHIHTCTNTHKLFSYTKR